MVHVSVVDAARLQATTLERLEHSGILGRFIQGAILPFCIVWADRHSGLLALRNQPQNSGRLAPPVVPSTPRCRGNTPLLSAGMDTGSSSNPSARPIARFPPRRST